MKLYKSPKVIFEKINLNKDIAAVCWGYSSNGKGGNLFYNTPGTGWVNFTLTSKTNCKDTNSVTYSILGYPNVPDEKQEQAKADFEKWWNEQVSNGHSNFEGEGYSEDNPNPGWS